MDNLFVELRRAVGNNNLWYRYHEEQFEVYIKDIQKYKEIMEKFQEDPELFKRKFIFTQKRSYKGKDFHTEMAKIAMCKITLPLWATVENPECYPRLTYDHQLIEPIRRQATIKDTEELIKALNSGNYVLNLPEQGMMMMCAYLRTIGQVDMADKIFIQIEQYLPNVEVYPCYTDNSMNDFVVENPKIGPDTEINESFLNKLDRYIEFLESLMMPGHPEISLLISRMRNVWYIPYKTVKIPIGNLTDIPGFQFLIDNCKTSSDENNERVLKSVQDLLLQYMTFFVDSPMSNEFIDRIVRMLDIIGINSFFLKSKDRRFIDKVCDRKLQDTDPRLVDGDNISSLSKLIVDWLSVSRPSEYYLKFFGITDLVESLLAINNPELDIGYESLNIEERKRLKKEYLESIDGILKPIYSVCRGNQTPYSNLKGLQRRFLANNLASIIRILSIGGFMTQEALIDLAVSSFRNLWMKNCSRELSNGQSLINYILKDSLSYFLSIMPDNIRETCIADMVPCLIQTNKSVQLNSRQDVVIKNVSSATKDPRCEEKNMERLRFLIKEIQILDATKAKNKCKWEKRCIPKEIKISRREVAFDNTNLEHLKQAKTLSKSRFCEECNIENERNILISKLLKIISHLPESNYEQLLNEAFPEHTFFQKASIKKSDTNADNILLEVQNFVSALRRGSFLVIEDV